MTKLSIALVLAGLVLAASSANAQTKISGTIQCAKPDPQNVLPVGDRPGHVLVTGKVKCTWTKPLDLAGAQTKTGEDATFSDVDGARSRDSGYHMTIMDSGDRFVVRFTGTSTLGKDGAVQTQMGTWSFVRGGGKLKGITGRGTYKATGGADGSVTSDIEGEYQIAGK
ncbi:MAG: hypothetical protein ABSA96_00675 [Candidatus Acidiferrales bacterium]